MYLPYKIIFNCQRPKLVKELKANHNQAFDHTASFKDCQRPKLVKELKANHNKMQVRHKQLKIVKDLS